MKNRAILFDLDGTLIDQFKAIHSAFSKTIVKMGYPPPSFEKVKRSIGGSSDVTMAKLIGPERAKEAVSILRPIFEKEMLNGLHALPGVINGLRMIKKTGYRCAVLTNKFGPHARISCKHLGLEEFLEFTIGAGDTKWRKPEAQLTRLAINRLGLNPPETIYVGDSPYDFETAKNANIRCYLVATGTHSLDELSTLQKHNVYPNFKSLTQMILKST